MNIPNIDDQLDKIKDLRWDEKMKQRIIIPCKVCGEPIDVNVKSYKQILRTGKGGLCKKCQADQAKERYANLPDEEKARRSEMGKRNATAQWAAMDKEQRIKQTANAVAAMKKFRDEITPEKRAEVSAKMSIAHKNYYDSLSDEKKKAYVAPMRAGAKVFYENISEEEKNERLQKLEEGKRQWWDNATDEERARMSEIRKQAAHDYWDNVTDEDRVKISNKQRETIKRYWNTMTPDEFMEWTKGRIAAHDISKVLETPTEIKFEGMLQDRGIDYWIQQPNIVEEDGFRQKFEYYDEDAGRMRYASPFHRWDFVIHDGGDKRAIYIDLDGSIHNPNKGAFRKSSTGSKYIQSVDDRRPYQTDGKRAFVIECWNDKLTESTPVKEIGKEGKITLKDLLEILPRGNKSEESSTTMA